MSRKSWNSKKIPRNFQENLKKIEKSLKTIQREFQKKSKELPRKFQENSKKQLLTRNNDSHESHESHEIHETIDNPKRWQSWKIWHWKLWKPWKSWNYSCVTGVVMTTYSLREAVIKKKKIQNVNFFQIGLGPPPPPSKCKLFSKSFLSIFFLN